MLKGSIKEWESEEDGFPKQHLQTGARVDKNGTGSKNAGVYH